MNQMTTKLQGSTLYNLYKSFTPASRAVLLFLIPFTAVDAIHYFTAGTALIFSFPLMVLIYLLCGGLAAKMAYHDGQGTTRLAVVGRSAGIRLWLSSTIINTLLGILLGFASFGISILSGALYLCLLAPFHALGSALTGWLGGWLFQQYIHRTKPLL